VPRELRDDRARIFEALQVVRFEPDRRHDRHVAAERVAERPLHGAPDVGYQLWVATPRGPVGPGVWHPACGQGCLPDVASDIEHSARGEISIDVGVGRDAGGEAGVVDDRLVGAQVRKRDADE
jgi:hypothetical protein